MRDLNSPIEPSKPFRLSAASHVVLGLIKLRGPSTSYDLKRAVGRSIQYFWSFPHTQLYLEPSRLSDAGFLSEEQESTGRRRKIYSLTASGEEALLNWMKDAPENMFELRDMAILQLFFSDFMEPDALTSLAQEQVRFHQSRIDTFDAIAERSRRFAGQNRMYPLELGIRLSRTCIEFWDEIEAETQGHREAGEKRSPPVLEDSRRA